MDQALVLKKTAGSVFQKFEITADEILAQVDINSYESVRDRLALKIRDLIDHDFEQLLNILYRIDVSEEKIKKYLSENPPGEAPALIADLIIEREMQKVVTRMQYSRGEGDY